MENIIKYTVADHIDPLADCFYHYVNGYNDDFQPHCHEYYEILFTVSGTIHHFINGKIHNLPEGSLVFIRPDDVHGYMYNTKEDRQSAYINLSFTKEMAESLFTYLSEEDFPVRSLLTSSNPPTIILNAAAKERLLFQLTQLNTSNWKNKLALKLHVKITLADIFVQNFYNISQFVRSDIPYWFQHLLKEMEQVENFTIGTARMVELSKKSYEHLARVTKKYLNLTLTQYINKLRINYAANLLLNSNSSIIDICYLCGFQNLGYFYKVFKEEYTMSPSQYISHHKIS